MKDGWYIIEDKEGFAWELWDNGKLLVLCSDSFKQQILNHPVFQSEYKKIHNTD